MIASTPVLTDVVSVLFAAGFAVAQEASGMSAGVVQLRPAAETEGAPLVLRPASPRLRVRLLEALQRSGYSVTQLPGDLLQLTGSPKASELLLDFQLPMRLPTFNPQLRTHWAKKGSRMQDLAWLVLAAVPPSDRPKAPLQGIEMEIDRFSTQEPDEENLIGCAKWIRDVLQPMHPRLRPYGLGFILEDAKWCVHHLRVSHIHSREHRTDVRIYRSQQESRSVL